MPKSDGISGWELCPENKYFVGKNRGEMITVLHDKLGEYRPSRMPPSGTKKLHLDKTNLTHIYILHWILKVTTVVVLIKIYSFVIYKGLSDWRFTNSPMYKWLEFSHILSVITLYLVSTKQKKMHNLEVESYALFSGHFKTLSPRDTPSQKMLKDCSKKARGISQDM